MILLFSLVILTSIWCVGIKIVTAEGMIFQKVGWYAETKIEEGKIIFEPLVYCEFCMPSIHSLFGYGFAIGMGLISKFSWSLVFMYPLVAMGSSITSGLLWALIKKAISSPMDEILELEGRSYQNSN